MSNEIPKDQTLMSTSLDAELQTWFLFIQQLEEKRQKLDETYNVLFQQHYKNQQIIDELQKANKPVEDELEVNEKIKRDYEVQMENLFIRTDEDRAQILEINKEKQKMQEIFKQEMQKIFQKMQELPEMFCAEAIENFNKEKEIQGEQLLALKNSLVQKLQNLTQNNNHKLEEYETPANLKDVQTKIMKMNEKKVEKNTKVLKRIDEVKKNIDILKRNISDMEAKIKNN